MNWAESKIRALEKTTIEDFFGNNVKLQTARDRGKAVIVYRRLTSSMMRISWTGR